MYETHFGLSGRPFAIAPDPDFYFASTTHQRALAYLQYAALEGSSLVVVTGAIGVGKTMLVQTLQRRLDPRSIAVAQLIGPRLGADDLPRALLAAFGIATAHDEPQAALQRHLAALGADARRALLIVDDAHELPSDALHCLLRLAMPRTAASRALQIALVGQPALRRLLRQEPPDAAGHSVDVFCHLAEFEPAETATYIEHRLRRVGWEQRPAIPAPAREAIQRATSGVPLRINRLCDRLLLNACLAELDTISPALVERIDGELHDEFDAVQTQSSTSAAAYADSAMLAPARLSIPTLVSVIENAQPLASIEPALYAAPATPSAPRWADDAGRDEEASAAPRPKRAAPRWMPAAGVLGAAAAAALIGLVAYRDNAPSPLGTERASTTATQTDAAVTPPVTAGSPHPAVPAASVAPSTSGRSEPAPLAIEALTSASPSGAGTRAEAAGTGAATGEAAAPADVAASPPTDAALADAKPRAARPAARGVKDSVHAAPTAAPLAPGVLGPCTDAVDALGLCTPPSRPDRR
jgi:type II secretory pathway predicted ATPase ExeA